MGVAITRAPYGVGPLKQRSPNPILQMIDEFNSDDDTPLHAQIQESEQIISSTEIQVLDHPSTSKPSKKYSANRYL